MSDDPNPNDPNPFKAPANQQEFDQMIAERIRRERAKFEGFDAFKEKAEKFDQLDQANKTDLQRAADQVTAAEAARTAAEEAKTTAERLAADRAVELLRFQIAATKGITGDDLVLLTGSDKDAIEKQADRIVALNKGQRIDPGQGRGGHTTTGSAGLAEAARRFGDASK